MLCMLRRITASVFAVLLMCNTAFAEMSRSACLMNMITGEIVYEKNSRQRLPMASTTKIVTALTAILNSDPDDIVTVSQNAVMQEGSSAYLEPGAALTMRDALYGLMLNSGNDAAVAVAENVSGSVEKFAEEMTSLARKAGAKNTLFKNPNGLHDENHYTTAEDLALLTRYAMQNEEFKRIVSSTEYMAKMTLADGTVKNVQYINHNKLLRMYEGCIGVKTGFTKAAGRCLVSAAEREGAAYIAVTLNDPDDWKDHMEMLDSAFDSVRKITAVKKGDSLRHIVSGNSQCELIAAEDFIIPVNGRKAKNAEVRLNIPKDLSPPLNKGEKVGFAEIYCEDIRIGTIDVTADRDFYAQGEVKSKPCFVSVFKRLLRGVL